MKAEREGVSLGPRLAQLRPRRRMKLRELSSLSGASTSLISQIENGRTNPTVEKLQNLATALGVPVSYFFDPHDGYDDDERDARFPLPARDGSTEAAVSPQTVDRNAHSERRDSRAPHHPTPGLEAG